MSRKIVYFLNTGGVDYTAEELQAVFENGDSLIEWNHKDTPDRYTDGDGWDGWGELTWGNHYVCIDGVEHPLEVVSTNDSSSYQYDVWVVFVLEGRFFRVDGTYESYVGSEWGPLREVTKGTKVVEVYE